MAHSTKGWEPSVASPSISGFEPGKLILSQFPINYRSFEWGPTKWLPPKSNLSLFMRALPKVQAA